MYSLQPLKKKDLEKLQTEKLNYIEMAKRLDCSLPTVKKYLKKYELIGKYVRTIPVDIDELYKLRVEQRWTYRRLAKYYNVSDTTLRNRCEEFDFPVVNAGRKASEWRLKPIIVRRKVNKNANKKLKELYKIL